MALPARRLEFLNKIIIEPPRPVIFPPPQTAASHSFPFKSDAVRATSVKFDGIPLLR